MKAKIFLSSFVATGVLISGLSTSALAIGGTSGAKTDYQVTGKLGGIYMDPYELTPLSAIILNGGYIIKEAKVTILPKQDGVTIRYKVGPQSLKTYGGIPVVGLYADYQNQVEVEYTKVFKGQDEKVKETYNITTPPFYQISAGSAGKVGNPFVSVEISKVDPEFKDRMYLVNNIRGKTAIRSGSYVWNSPVGGAAEWNYPSNAFVVDTKGEIRWYINSDNLLDYNNIYNTGIMMGFRQNSDGALSWGFGQRYVKYDFVGREIFNRRLPIGYQDFSHSMDNMQNGNYLLRVASSNYKRPDGKNVRTVRDVIIEVDHQGNVVDEWRLFDILDQYRSDVVKVLDQGAVCLNIDASQAGHTLSEEDLAKMDASDSFGDIAGTGAGRNWAHVNSVDYDPSDDSIIISSRHQNAVIKIGRDKKVKWILGGHKGWKGEFVSKLLQPVDSKGNKIICDDEYTKCPGYTDEANGGFDWTYTQHTAFRIDSKSKKGIVYLTVFDNGDSRGFEQPAIPDMKYSRAVVYKVDEKAKTVEQIWEYGKERGKEWYSPVTSLAEYQVDKNSIMVYSATAGMQFDFKAGKPLSAPKPEIDEFKWGATEPSVQMRFTGVGSTGYQAMPINFQKAFEK
ncbi:aryl-sulfate sulfotransferase [Campylobacter sp. faydin G-140]|uniref:aryl-sulfate sulfotransferase n=1 Tax=Campylobacter anatolicus TaxID=2829105 RepID=UPI001B9AD47F|nr:aryl-sulfate sulfotransferase [Campylobacter anatolicus]MBR8464959.1 aryl-sulfate sulfotransferase [Campylobacter anatolicus]